MIVRMLTCIALTLALAGTVVAGEQSACFQSIFNGKDLTGWEGNPDLWSVQDGAITGKTDGNLKYNTFLIWKGGTVENFELKLKYRIVGGNSGIQYRSKVLDPEKYIVGGYQADFEAGDKYSGILYEERGKRGIMALRGHKVTHKADGTKEDVQFADTAELQSNILKEQWNNYTIIANGNHLIHKINGKTTVEVIDEQTQHAAIEGVLALQIHVGPAMTVQFKDIKLKQLPSTLYDPNKATDPRKITIADGFNVELLYNVPRDEQGSWVSITTDPKGRLIVSDQAGKLYRVTPAPIGEPAWKTKVEMIDLPIGGAQGLLYAFDSLYVMVNHPGVAQGSGLYRVFDTDDDDMFDKVVPLRLMPGRGGEHGPHAIRLSPDGQSLYVIGGNHTDLPEYDQSRIPTNWGEDQLLPRMWDAIGHAVGRMAPAGWICKIDPEGKNWEVFSIGYRNQFDIAFNKHGDLFTYDADMEWDIGSPWYRPTRVCHATSGSEFGWRGGTGKFPVYYPDNLPPVINIGPGSPTGIEFGYNAKFPAKYQDSLFISDWSFGKMYAVHLKPDGSTYAADKELFMTASPLPLTDLTINPVDGAMYFMVGGRATQSGLYRVTYTGTEDTAAAPAKPLNREAGIRRMLEAYHGRQDPKAVEVAWPYMGHPDRFIRYAARIAVERQPVSEWREKALSETHPQALLTGLLALARQGDPSDQPRLFQAMGNASHIEKTEAQLLEAYRVISLALIRLGEPDPGLASGVAEYLNTRYPSASVDQNYELSRLLIYLQSPAAATKTVKLLTEAPTQEEQIHYALVLRNLKTGWTPELRDAYFGWFNKARTFKGGNSFAKFIQKIRGEALENVPESEKSRMATLLAEFEKPLEQVEVEPREFVKQWSIDEVTRMVEGNLKGRDYENGRKMFGAAQCYNCHRFNGEGGSVGPDLTSVAGRFAVHDLVESIIDPNKAVSDQYRNTMFILNNGQQVIGRVANLSKDILQIVTDQLAPGDFTPIKRDMIVSQVESPISPMMGGLLNTLNSEEILDLMAYLMSGGDRNHPAFK